MQFLFFVIGAPITAFSQLVSVTGNITNQITGEAIENVSVFESKTGIGTITNKDGYFKLLLKPGDVSLIFANDGFGLIDKKIELKNEMVLNISLKPTETPKKGNKKDSVIQISSTADLNQVASYRRKNFVF